MTTGNGSGDLATTVRQLLALLTDGRTELSPAEARWAEQARRVLADPGLLDRLERVRAQLTKADGRLLHRIMLAILGDFGVRADDPRIPEIVPRRIREIAAADKPERT